MRLKIIFFHTVIYLFISVATAAQTAVDSLVIGVWKGVSLCQLKNSPCHDEEVVYHISKTANPKEFTLLMNKVIKDVEEEMGTLICQFDDKKRELTCSPKPNTIWNFTVFAKKMTGTLYYNAGLFRIISVTKSL